MGFSIPLLTLFPHAHFEALFQSAVLALIPMVLVYRAVPRAAALVRQVPPHGPLEEALAACIRKVSIIRIHVGALRLS